MKPSHLVRLLFLVSAVMALGCERSVEKSKVSIVMPGSNYVSSGVLASTSSVFAQSDKSLDWMQIAATGYSDRYNINCFIVMVSAPDINNGSCHKLVPSMAAAPEDQTIFRYGMIAGAVPAGSVLDLELVPGSARVFTVYGMHSDSAISCSLFSSGLFNRSTMTKPYYVGESLPQQLNGGSSNSVSIVGQPFDPSKYIDYCDSEPALGGVQQSLTPGALQVKFDTNVSGAFDTGSCIPVDVGFKDTTGLQSVAAGYSGKIALQFPLGGILQSYDSMFECLNSVNAFSNFSLGEFSTRRYVKASDLFGITNLNIIGTPALASSELYPGMPNVVSTPSNEILASVPEIIRNGVCYPVSFSLNTTDHSGNGLFSATGSWTTNTFFSPVGGAADYYSDSACTTFVASTSANGPHYISTAFVKTWVKFSNLNDGDKVTLRLSLSAPSVVNYFTARAKGNSGSSTAIKLKIQGPTEFPLAVGCYGPFRLSAVDQYGAEVSAGSRQIQLSINADELAVYANVPQSADPCSGIGSSLVTINTPASVTLTTAQFFYVKLYNNSTYSLTQYAYASDLSASNKLLPTIEPLNITNSAAAFEPVRDPPVPFHLCFNCALP